jgi:hypothetical protein
MDMQFMGILAFLAAIIISRLMSEKALRFLNTEQKDALMEGFYKYRILFMLPVILVIGLFYAGVLLFPEHKGQVTLAGFALLLVYVITTNTLVFRKLKALNLPREYTLRIIFARLILYASLCAFIFIFAASGRVEI